MRFKKTIVLLLSTFLLTGCDGFGSFFYRMISPSEKETGQESDLSSAFNTFTEASSYYFTVELAPTDNKTDSITYGIKQVDTGKSDESYIVYISSLADKTIKYIAKDKDEYYSIFPNDNNVLEKKKIKVKAIPKDMKFDYICETIMEITLIKENLDDFIYDEKENRYIYKGKIKELSETNISIDNKNKLRAISRIRNIDGKEFQITFISNGHELNYKDLNFDIR